MTPSYLANVAISSSDSTPHPAIVLSTIGSVRTLIPWDYIGVTTQVAIDHVLMSYAAKNNLTTANALQISNSKGWQVIEFSITLNNSTATLLTSTFSSIINVDGTDYVISATPSNSSTFGSLITTINAQLTTAVLSIVGTTLHLTTNNALSSIIIKDASLFWSLNSMVRIGDSYKGVATLAELLTSNFPNAAPLGIRTVIINKSGAPVNNKNLTPAVVYSSDTNTATWTNSPVTDITISFVVTTAATALQNSQYCLVVFNATDDGNALQLLSDPGGKTITTYYEWVFVGERFHKVFPDNAPITRIDVLPIGVTTSRILISAN